MEIEVYSNTEHPVRSKDLLGEEEDFSVDVITRSENGMVNIAFYNYDLDTWQFHTDTLVDPYEKGVVMDFVWMYIPEILSA